MALFRLIRSRTYRHFATATSLSQATREPSSFDALVLTPEDECTTTGRATPSSDLTCMNIMCEYVGRPCVCKLASCLSRLPHLQRLEIAGHGLHALPDTIRSLENLTYLDVSSNELTDLSVLTESGDISGESEEPRGGYSGLRNLTTLKADNNLLTDVDLRPFPALKEVSLRNNNISKVPLLPVGKLLNTGLAASERKLPPDIELDLYGNPI